MLEINEIAEILCRHTSKKLPKNIMESDNVTLRNLISFIFEKDNPTTGDSTILVHERLANDIMSVLIMLDISHMSEDYRGIATKITLI